MKFKVGDKVKIIKMIKDCGYWIQDMDQFVEKIGIVELAEEEYGNKSYAVRVDKQAFIYPEEALELAEGSSELINHDGMIYNPFTGRWSWF